MNSMMIMVDSYLFWFSSIPQYILLLCIAPSHKHSFLNTPYKPFLNIEELLTMLFKMILILNISSLIPFSIPLSSMTDLVFLTSFFIWTSIISNKILHPEKIILQLTLCNTPIWISPVMIMVETTSNIIRPITLALRLSGNMLVGHFLLQNMSSSSYLLIVLTFFFMFESAICTIQATVYSLLISSYKAEV